ncbi:MAG: Gfo/Idh/MocA family protein [Fusicatenibacter sp.]
MEEFRFVILGAGNIAARFCDAVCHVKNCKVSAVASKSLERAKQFAQNNQIEHFYGSYEEMLDIEKPDGAYIAVTPNDHYRLTMMCLERKIPVLCEKAMFQNSGEAKKAFDFAREQQTFVMEAMWSRFLPAVRHTGEWLRKGKIGQPVLARFTIGFCAPEDENNRYYNPKLGGGAAKDITVYAYELTTYLLAQKIQGIRVNADWSTTGVDLTDHVSISFEHTMADLMATFEANVEEQMVLYGKKGKIVLPCPHYASECFLYGEDGQLLERFQDETTVNGFTYEIEEMISCVRKGKTESKVVPHQVTLECAKLFDQIEETKYRIHSRR